MPDAKKPPPDKYKIEKNLEELMKIIAFLMNNRHYGYLQINFFDGGITTVNTLKTQKVGTE